MYEKVGRSKNSAAALSFSPEGILRKEINKEHDENCTNAYELMDEISVSRSANYISSHCVFKIKYGADGEGFKLKARIVLNVHRDQEKDNLQKDSAAGDMTIARMVISITTCMFFVGRR